ncbi:MAG: hypothetical protein JOZ31_21255 [Verrucomicrobia bacterium]|nr:hypothetical protein [Verrucomicrobiota bacterium]
MVGKSVLLLLVLSLVGGGPALGFTKLADGTLQSNGSEFDTQAAINAARPGSTVQIPNGNYSWTLGVVILGKPIRLKAESVDGVTITNRSTADALISVFEARNGNVDVGGFRFLPGFSSGPPGMRNDIRVTHSPGGKPVLVHDCYFETNYVSAIFGLGWGTNGGVIWRCKFFSNYNLDGGIQFKSTSSETWRTPSTIGMADVNGTANTYIEDCTFIGIFIGAVDFDDNSRTVLRHCTLEDSMVYCHGQDTSPDGARHWEVYDNKFIYTASGSPPGFPNVSYPLNLQAWLSIRGGTGIIADNVFQNISTKNQAIQMNVFSINRRSLTIPCQTRYPAARQVGQTWIGAGGYSYTNAPIDGGGYSTDPVYIWGNSGTATDSPAFVGLNQYLPDECGNGQRISDYVKAGRDYILGKPKPGYAKFTYPHPLRVTAEARWSSRTR